MAVSCDSFNEDTNSQIGRHQAGKGNLKCLQNVRDWCRKYHVAFKINTVVNVYNVDEDMNENIQKLAPIRWKVSKDDNNDNDNDYNNDNNNDDNNDNNNDNDDNNDNSNDNDDNNDNNNHNDDISDNSNDYNNGHFNDKNGNDNNNYPNNVQSELY